MRKIFNDDDFNTLKKFILSDCYCPNANRCLLFWTDDNNMLTMCLNEKLNMVTICNSDFIIDKSIFDKLLYAAKEVECYSNMYQFYKENIEPNTECCI